MADAPRIAFKELTGLVDGEELRKGAEIFDGKGLEHLSRYETKLFAEAKGSGASPYKVQILLDGEKPKGRCSCMAARSRPFCKHAAALLVAWSRAPDGFAVSDTAPAAAAGDGKKREVKKGKVDNVALMSGGVEQVSTLVRELALSGVAAIGVDRAAQIRALGEGLRESKLRRLSARTVAISDMVATAATDHARFEPSAFAELLADTVVTVRKLEKHLAGEALEDKYVEELIGKTWTKKERKPISGLELIEYGFFARTTPDGFVIRESRFFDLASGEHFSEKQIVPGFLAGRTDAKKSRAGWVLHGASGSVYPSFSPVRLDLEDSGNQLPLSGAGADSAPLEAMVAKALPTVTAALAAFQERRRDVLAPDTLPIALAADTLLAEGVRLQVVDKDGGALFLPDDPGLDEGLGSALRGATLLALLGDIALEGALPTLYPVAVMVRTVTGLELRPLGGDDASKLRETRKVKRTTHTTRRTGAEASSWVDTARAVGVSAAAIALGEVQEELAQAFVTGLSSVVPRFTDPLVARLRELGLEKPAALLDATAKKTDPAERLDDLVKLYQVLGIALTRLVGATHVDRAALTPVPTFESVHVNRTDDLLPPKETAERLGRGTLNRYQAAVRYAAWFDRMPVEELGKNVYPSWADGSISHFIARVFAGHPAEAVAAAKRALGFGVMTGKSWHQPRANMVRLTAFRVLEAVGTAEAVAVLKLFIERSNGVTTAPAHRALRAIEQRRGVDTAPMRASDWEKLDELRNALLSAPNKQTRQDAAEELGALGYLEAIPALRMSMRGDVSGDVRERSAMILGTLGDAESVDGFIAAVAARHEDPEAAKLAARALGSLGDVRAVPVLVDAWAEGWLPGVLSEVLRDIGTATIEALVQRIEAKPELVKRKAALSTLEAMPPEDLAEVLTARLEALRDDPQFAAKATLLATLAGAHPRTLADCAEKVFALLPQLADQAATKDEKALLKKLQPPKSQNSGVNA